MSEEPKPKKRAEPPAPKQKAPDWALFSKVLLQAVPVHSSSSKRIGPGYAW